MSRATHRVNLRTCFVIAAVFLAMIPPLSIMAYIHASTGNIVSFYLTQMTIQIILTGVIIILMLIQTHIMAFQTSIMAT